MNEKSKIYDFLKICTSVLVVMGHCIVMYSSDGAIATLGNSELLASLTKLLYSFHMPLFICLSGCVYGYCVEKGKYNNFGKFALGKAKRLLIPYFFFCFALVLPVMKLCGLLPNGIKNYITKGILMSTDPRHLWYVYALFLIFILSALLKTFYKKHFYVYIIVGAVLWVLCTYYPIKMFQISALCDYYIYFVIGMALNRKYEVLRGLFIKIRYLFPFLTLCLMTVIFVDQIRISKISYAILGIVVCFFFSVLISKSIYSFLENRWVKRYSRDIFGVYIFHPMIIYPIFKFVGQVIYHPYLLCLLAFSVSFVLSIALTELFRRLHLGVLMGE